MKQSVYIVGDIHGCYRTMVNLIDKIELHAKANNIVDPELVFVGDYIDRGPNSRMVLIQVRDMVNKELMYGFSKVTALMGNHEDLLVESYSNKYAQETWMMNGGVAALESFNDTGKSLTDFMLDNNSNIVRMVGVELYNWVRELPRYYEIGSVAIAHAGIDDAFELAENHDPEALIWSRRLRKHAHNHYRFTVHGHTPMDEPFINENVAYIDTGAVFGRPYSDPRVLTALFIPDVNNPVHTDMEFITEVSEMSKGDDEWSASTTLRV